MPPAKEAPKRIAFRSGLLGAAVEAVARALDIAAGDEVEVREEDGRIVIEPVRPKLVAPASDAAAREERTRRVRASVQHVLDKHGEVLALLAQ
ncbi:MAG: AbrB/MazE/SpoVT family DNA-binding domain-containing protein [Polyangiaceae bacterium]